MSDALTVPPGETGKVRVFALNMPAEQVNFLHEPGAVADILGVDRLDTAHVDIFALRDLEELGLPGYLIEGCDVPAVQIAPDRARLKALRGHVLVVHSRAFDGQAENLAPAAALDLVAIYDVTPTDWSARTPIDTDSARRRAGSAQSPRAERARARRIGSGIFLVFMILFALIVWLVLG